MKNIVVFITKSLCYHQVYLSDALYSIYGDSFYFIQTREPLEFRIAAHQEGFDRPYLMGLARSEKERLNCFNILKCADVIIVGEASFNIMRHFNKKALVLRYSERIFKEELYHNTFFKKIKQHLWFWRLRFFIKPNKTFLLSAGSYTPLDYSKFFLFKNKAYIWGYFPNYYKQPFFKKNNQIIQIVWMSRLIQVKHPESAILVALFLRRKKVKFVLHIIGDGDETSGELKEQLINSIHDNDLKDCVVMHGKIPAEEALSFYKKCDIALFTSSFTDGWGVGINEAMNAGCAVISAHSIGAARYMIDDGVNGLIYKYSDNDSLCNKVYQLCLNEEYRTNLGKNAYFTIQKMWNYNNAAKRLSILIKNLLEKKDSPFLNGPCSKAPFLKEDWHY